MITPYEGTPSFRAGIRPGDVISAVDGKTADGMTSDLVAKALKGPKGTHVQVTMVREGQAEAAGLRPGSRRDSPPLRGP